MIYVSLLLIFLLCSFSLFEQNFFNFLWNIGIGPATRWGQNAWKYKINMALLVLLFLSILFQVLVL